MKVAVILPRGMVFSPKGATSIDLVAHDLYQASRYKESTYVIGAGVREPFDGVDFRPVEAESQAEFIRKAAGILKSDLPDLVVVHQHPESAAAISRFCAPVPVVLHRHGLMRHKRGWLSRWRKGRSLKPIHGFIFVSDFIRQGFLRAYPHLEPKTSVVFNGVDCREWRPLERKNQTVIYVGRAREDKGVDILLDAFKDIRQPGWHLDLVLGVQTDAERAYFQRIGAKVAPDEPISIFRNLTSSEVKGRLGQAAIAALPSIVEEGFPRAVVEAMACGCATIATASGGTPEAAGTCAILLPRSEAETTGENLAAALRGLINDEQKRMALSEAARRHVLSTLDLAAVAAAYDACLDRQLEPDPL
ncbi:hypothetical protein GCM10011316_36380 [Roseibium aquae]|uniref:Glycosyltransferase involved in cell wall biosynthesis n=1 Tax=Roseibium aquae TaxID=1323746 RepID=A0A916TMZ6_9HYPH|nr:glycosyltransferase family 4 protein [Roseibium aquae]GGB61112.1 hypothetical protein GCM10011316_36380 [Roseibium aquae]